jgi:hypothetical protein
MTRGHIGTRIAAVALLALVVITGVVWTRTIEVRVPDDFHGLIRVTCDPTAKPLSAGLFRLVLDVPASGEVAIPDLDVIRRFHRQVARRFNGSPLPLGFPGQPSHGVALHVMNTPPTPQVFYYVGTREELLQFLTRAGHRLYSVRAPRA